MTVALVTLKNIVVHQTDESGDAEWHFWASTSGGGQHKDFRWDANGVTNGGVYDFGWSNFFVLDPGQKIILKAGGYEEDDPGFPLFDDHDGLPGINDPYGIEVDPSAVDPVVDRVGVDYAFSAFTRDGFHYSLHWDINNYG